MIQIIPRHEIERYLLTYDPEEKRAAHALWKEYTARGDIIDFKHYSYNPENLRYTDARRNRLIPDSQMAVDAIRFSNGIRNALRELAGKKIKQGDEQGFYDEMLRTMKLSYRATVDVANGGKPIDENQKRILTGLLLLYFLRLNRFAEGINSGLTPFSEAILSRVGMYGLNNKSIWENWRYEAARALGYAEARRIPGPTEHCQNSATRPGCDELIQRGWMPISTMPILGSCTCLSNCQCRLEFRDRTFALYGALEVATNTNSYINVYNHDGKLLFRFDPKGDNIEIKHRWQSKPVIVDLNEYRNGV